MSRRPTVPAYRLYKQSGQAIVTLPDGRGGCRDVLLGPHGTAASRAEYGRVIAEWEANGRRLAQPAAVPSLSVNELAVAYYRWAVEYYRWGTRDGHCLKDALRVLEELYGLTQARDFGPRALKACRQRMIEMEWSRTYTNSQVNRLRRIFRRAAEEELLPGSVYQNLKAVAGLQAGRSTARETKKIRPVETDVVDATVPHLPAFVRALVRLQLLTGARPTDVCTIRPLDIDVRNPACWVYRPGSDQGPHSRHKTAGVSGPQDAPGPTPGPVGRPAYGTSRPGRGQNRGVGIVRHRPAMCIPFPSAPRDGGSGWSAPGAGPLFLTAPSCRLAAIIPRLLRDDFHPVFTSPLWKGGQWDRLNTNSHHRTDGTRPPSPGAAPAAFTEDGPEPAPFARRVTAMDPEGPRCRGRLRVLVIGDVPDGGDSLALLLRL